MNSITKDLHLSAIDQSVYRQYVRHLHIFPFPDVSYADDALHALRTGLSSTLREYPFLAGTLKVPDLSTGLLKATCPDPIRRDYGNIMLTASFALAATRKFDYHALEEAGFPPAMLPAYAFCPPGLRNHAGLDDPYAETSASAAKGYRIPIMCAQATFIPGGLVLSLYAHHSVVDGCAIIKLYEVRSYYVRGLKNGSSENVKLPRVDACHFSTERRRLDATTDTTTFWPVPHYPELATVTTKTPVTPLRSTPYDVKAKVFRFPASYIANLRSDLQALTKIRISTFTSIAALMWTHITRSPQSRIHHHSSRNTRQSASTSRARTLARIHGQRRPLRHHSPAHRMDDNPRFTHYTTPPPPRRPSNHNNPQIHLTLLAHQTPHYLSSLEDPSIKTNAFTYVNGPDLIINSWQFQGADCEWDIPGTTDKKASAIRKPSYLSEGGVRILPRRSDGQSDYEVLVSLEDGEMGRLVEGLEGVVGRVVDG